MKNLIINSIAVMRIGANTLVHAFAWVISIIGICLFLVALAGAAFGGFYLILTGHWIWGLIEVFLFYSIIGAKSDIS